MKSIFNPQTIEELKQRIHQLDTTSAALWGEMNVYQMLKHCTENEKMLLGEKTFKRLFIGRLFGPMALKSNIKDDSPLNRNSPTHPALKITYNGDLEEEKSLWLRLLDAYPTRKPSDYSSFVHPFFGKMNSDQVSRFAYKHIDHHLRQFGV